VPVHKVGGKYTKPYLIQYPKTKINIAILIKANKILAIFTLNGNKA